MQADETCTAPFALQRTAEENKVSSEAAMESADPENPCAELCELQNEKNLYWLQVL